MSLLTGVRVVETASGGAAERCGRLLADLGADVVKVEPPEGAPSRREPPIHDGVSLPFAVRNSGKRCVAGSEPPTALLADADIWIHDGRHPDAGSANPALVELAITPFGQSGPYRDWVATESTLLAMGGVLSRSGLPGREPLLPPGGLAESVTAAQAAWAALVAYWNRLETGHGDAIDFSLYEATVVAIEPAMGTVGTAQIAGIEPTRGRPAPGPYPIFACRDGHVRVVLLAVRQWRAMRAWLGEPEDLQDPELDSIRGRAVAFERLRAAISELFRDRGKHELAEEGQARGVPVAPVLDLGEVLDAEHYRGRGAIGECELAPGLTAVLPRGWVEVDGARSGATAPAADTRSARSDRPRQSTNGSGVSRRPLDGLRVLDFGVIVYGAEAARLFCEQGAEVIKIESRAFADGARVSPVGFAVGHRGSKSVGVNLRTPEGVDVVKRLVQCSDLVLANFKPGTLDRLGLGAEVLCALNPRITLVNASAVGTSGRWSGWMGYGPLVRCLAGLTSLWRYPDDPQSFSDSTVVHPDHYAARLAALAALAALIRRKRTGAGAHVEVSQAETILNQLAEVLAEASLRPQAIGPSANSGRHAAPCRIYPCAGDDEWCAITVRDDAEWRGLRRALGDPPWAAAAELASADGRLAKRQEIDRHLARWTSTLRPRDATAALQREGVPAGFMQRPEEYERDPQLRARDFFATFGQPGLEPRTIERVPLRSARIPAPAPRPAPAPGEHTREVCREVLAMAPGEIERLLEDGVLEGSGADVPVGA